MTTPPSAGLPFRADQLLRQWEQLSRRAGWSPSLPWRTKETVAVAEASTAGEPLETVLFAFGYQRALDGAGAGELRNDVESLATVLRDVQAAPTPYLDLLPAAIQGMEAATAAAVLESTLLDPLTGFLTPAGLISVLWAPTGGPRLHCEDLWVHRWTADHGVWRTMALRMKITATIRPLLGRHDSAAFLDEFSIAVLLDEPERHGDIDTALRGIDTLTVTESVNHVVPRLESLSALIAWVLRTCPELIATINGTRHIAE